MDVFVYCVRVSLCRQRLYDGLIPRPRSPTNAYKIHNFVIISECAQAREPNPSKTTNLRKIWLIIEVVEIASFGTLFMDALLHRVNEPDVK
jgi:hypothetical protein